MKNENCPNCGGKLGVPEKLKGHPVRCPKCDLEFVPDEVHRKSKSERKRKSPSNAKQPALRAVPLPTAVSERETEGSGSVTQLERSTAPLMPPKKKRKSKKKLETTSSAVMSVETERVPESRKSEFSSSAEVPAEAIDPPTVAKIIQQETVEPQLTKDGKLPTLLLADEVKPRISDKGGWKSNPIFVGLLICFSLVSSGGMLFLIESGQPDAKKEVESARNDVVRFYQVRDDQVLKPFQRELREAQRAHSREDYSAESNYYQKVMLRFKNENLVKYAGLTGSPVGDKELEKHVSLLLKDAKKRAK
tara:strand:+ start:1524 stop:2438 length:915 start_codon:yes stop_codon:yes gene_type:complete